LYGKHHLACRVGSAGAGVGDVESKLDLVSSRDRGVGRWSGSGYVECAAVADLAHEGILRILGPVQLRLVRIWSSGELRGLGDAAHVSGAIDRVDGDSCALIQNVAAQIG